MSDANSILEELWAIIWDNKRQIFGWAVAIVLLVKFWPEIIWILNHFWEIVGVAILGIAILCGLWWYKRDKKNKEQSKKHLDKRDDLYPRLLQYTQLELPAIDELHSNICQLCLNTIGAEFSSELPNELPLEVEFEESSRFYCFWCGFDLNATMDDLTTFYRALFDPSDPDLPSNKELSSDLMGVPSFPFGDLRLKKEKLIGYFSFPKLRIHGAWDGDYVDRNIFDDQNYRYTVLNKVRAFHLSKLPHNLETEWDQQIVQNLFNPFIKDGNTQNFIELPTKSGKKRIRLSGRILMKSMNWEQFEVLTMHLLRFQGWDAELTEKEALYEGAEPTIDGGVDVIGTKGDRKVYLQAKHYINIKEKVGRPVVQQIYGAAAMASATDVIAATSGEFTEFAVSSAKTQDMNETGQYMKLELWDNNKMCKMIDNLSYENYLILEQIIDPEKDASVWYKNESGKFFSVWIESEQARKNYYLHR